MSQEPPPPPAVENPLTEEFSEENFLMLVFKLLIVERAELIQRQRLDDLKAQLRIATGGNPDSEPKAKSPE